MLEIIKHNSNNNTMITYIISLLLILASVGFYWFYLKPRRLINQYAKDFEKAGFKVLQYPYNIFEFFMVT